LEQQHAENNITRIETENLVGTMTLFDLQNQALLRKLSQWGSKQEILERIKKSESEEAKEKMDEKQGFKRKKRRLADLDDCLLQTLSFAELKSEK